MRKSEKLLIAKSGYYQCISRIKKYLRSFDFYCLTIKEHEETFQILAFHKKVRLYIVILTKKDGFIDEAKERERALNARLKFKKQLIKGFEYLLFCTGLADLKRQFIAIERKLYADKD